MTDIQRNMAKEIIKNTINYISAKEYEKLATVTSIAPAWCDDSGTQESGMREFGAWLDGQLEMWAEDEERDFVLDSYAERYVDMDDSGDNRMVAEYHPKSHGEDLDLWFEFKFFADDGKEMISEFDINI